MIIPVLGVILRTIPWKMLRKVLLFGPVITVATRTMTQNPDQHPAERNKTENEDNGIARVELNDGSHRITPHFLTYIDVCRLVRKNSILL